MTTATPRTSGRLARRAAPRARVVLSDATLRSLLAALFSLRPRRARARRYDDRDVLYKAHELTRWLKEKKRKDRHALLGGDDDASDAAEGGAGASAAEGAAAAASGNATDGGERRTLLYWKPTLRVQLVHMHMPFARNGVPPQIVQHMSFDPSGDYYPIVYARRARPASRAASRARARARLCPSRARVRS